MADPQDLARKARNTLADGLKALQEGDGVPDELLDIAEPIAQAMGMLHRIEKAEVQDAALANDALKKVRHTLDALQNVADAHAAVDAAMEAVAGSLSKLFALSKAIESGPATSRQPASAPPPPPKKGSRPPSAKKASRPPPPPRGEPFKGVNKTLPMQDGEDVRRQIHAAQAAAAAPAAQATIPQPPAAAAPVVQPTIPQPPAAPLTAAPLIAAPPTAAPFGAAPLPEAQPAAAVAHAPAPAGSAEAVSVELGAHSGSNFYKGLSGNDVIDHGGIFVATYKVPEIGATIALRMLLPGDLEFYADAVVQWTREIDGEDAEPGFGARFTRISAEGRELVYRYTKNREPMFYDDL